MNYESLSSLVLLVIAALLICGWLPGKTIMGMRRASEHREDRYSSSLHVVTQDDAARVGDARSHAGDMQRVKGSFMDSDRTQRNAAHKQEHIERIRQMRRAAIRRRQLIVATLAVIAIVLVAISATKLISFWYCLIPVALLAVVLALGARASSAAREWERRIAAADRGGQDAAGRRPVNRGASDGRARMQAERQPEVGSSKNPTVQSTRAPQSVQTSGSAHPSRSAQRQIRKNQQPHSSLRQSEAAPATATDVLNKAEIQRILQLARQEQRHAAKSNAAKSNAEKAPLDSGRNRTEGTGEAEASVIVADASPTERASADVEKTAGKTARSMAPQEARNAAPQQAKATSGKAALPNVDMPKLEQNSQQQAASQDLISFSLGTVRKSPEQDGDGPESLEIKSSRQVSVAIPRPKVEDETSEISVAGVVGKAELQSALADSAIDAQGEDAVAEDSSDTANGSSEESGSDSHAFHDAEIHASVEPPAQSSESLSIGLDAILSRRGSK